MKSRCLSTDIEQLAALMNNPKAIQAAALAIKSLEQHGPSSYSQMAEAFGWVKSDPKPSECAKRSAIMNKARNAIAKMEASLKSTDAPEKGK